MGRKQSFIGVGARRCASAVLLFILGFGGVIVVVGSGVTPAGAIAPTVFNSEGESQYTVPAGTVALQVTVVGAAAPGSASGDGAEVQATIPAPPTSTLYVEVGGTDGGNGGGTSTYSANGGGASDIQTCSVIESGCTDSAVPSTDPRLVVAGGGGGEGETFPDTGGAGGSAGTVDTSGVSGTGGAGTDSGAGTNGGSAGYTSVAGTPGVAGADSAGCGGGPDAATAGTPGQGGTGGNTDNEANGGGGGGGWVGGSGGGTGSCSGPGGGGGGGAGLSYVPSSASDVAVSDAGSTGAEVVITPVVGAAPAITSANAETFYAGQAGTFTVTTTGSPTPVLTSIGALPSGVTFTDNGDGTATIAGTPAAGTAGNYNLVLNATNGVVPDSTQSFVLTVGQAFTSTGEGTYSVPPGTVSLQVTLIGASGNPFAGNHIAGAGASGDGAEVQATIPAPAPSVSTLYVEVGGTDGSNGGGSSRFGANGGGASDIQTCSKFSLGCQVGTAVPGTDPRLIVAGGGGGGGENDENNGTPAGGAGGSAGTSDTSGVSGAGGDGADGGGGGDGGSAGSTSLSGSAGTTGADSATCSGTPDSTPAVAGGPTLGGSGSNANGGDSSNGGGGGGGWVGGSGGGSGGCVGIGAGGGGGAGLSYLPSYATGGSVGDAGTTTAEVLISAIVNQAPSITSADATGFTVGQPGSFQVTTSGSPTGTTMRLNASGLPGWATFTDDHDGSGVLTGTPPVGSEGTYDLTFAASNSVAPDASQDFTLSVNEPPSITSASATTFTAGTFGTFSVTTTGFPTPALSEIGALPSPVHFTDNGDGTATLSGTPAAGTGGTYTFAIDASNGVGPDATQEFTLTVDEAPAVTSADATTFTVGQLGSFTLTTSGFPTGASMVLGATGRPGWLSFTDHHNGTGTLSGTPPAGSGGTHDLTVTASNGVGTDASQDFTLTVNEAPAITSAAATTFTTGHVGAFTVTTTGFPVSALSEIGNLPTGVHLTDNGDGTASLGGTPVAGTGGTYTFAIDASNGVGPDATQAFTLTVHQSPSVTSANATTFTENHAGTFTVTSTGFPTGALSESGTLPTGVHFTDNGNGTATIAGTPATGSVGVYSITLTASNGVAPNGSQAFTLTVARNVYGAYRMVATDGGLFDFGGAGFFGSTGSIHLNKPVVGMASTSDGNGYWLVASDGGIFNYGNAHFFGSTGAIHLNKPVVAMAATPDGGGYWLVASDGGIFNYGNAHFFGSAAGMTTAPIVGMVATHDGGGYWLVGSDGSVYRFGDAASLGSLSGLHLNAPIVAVTGTPDGGGYVMVASDGGVFPFGDAQFYGSIAGIGLSKPIVGIESTPDGGGYWLASSDGGIFNYGDAAFSGAANEFALNAPIVGMG